jgi:FkbH-like protein
MKLVEALEALKHNAAIESPVLQVDLACGFTPLHFLTFLNAHLRAAFPGHKVQIGTGLYGDLPGTLARIEREKSSIVVAVVEWEDLDPRLGVRRLGGWRPGQLAGIVQSARDQASRLGDSLERIAQSGSVIVSAPTLPLPPFAFTPGWQSSSFENELREVVAEMMVRLSKSAGIRVVSSQRLDRISAPAERWDVKSALNTGFPYHLGHADQLAGIIARLAAAAPPKKGLITDLDDTLWMGILGEAGVDGIAWDLDHHAQKHGLYQQMLASLSEAGILIAAASKNNPALVEEAFQANRPVLARERIFPLEAGWGPKSEAVSRILRAWNIGADSVVFVDDSPLDLAEVKAVHPEMNCLLFPRDDDRAAYQLLEDLRDLFGKTSLSEEDAIRMESLRTSHAVLDAARAHGYTPDDFLRDAEGKLTVTASKTPLDPRALELINKTNQFNLNGRRITEASWRQYVDDPDVFVLLASYQDKFGPLGKIAVMAGRREGKRISVDHWVMSCRAFSRRIEHACLLYVFRKLEVEEALFDFAPTARNGPLQDFFAELGGGAPGAAFSLTAQRLSEKCPPVHLRVEELPDE